MFFMVFGAAVAQGVAQNRPVVDFGDDLCWYGKGIPSYRRGVEDGALKTENLGGGNWRIGHPFNLEMPLSPESSEYNTRGNSTRFYGGMMTLVYNSPDSKSHWTEGGVNIDHDGFDDFNYMGYSLKSTNNHLRAFGVWLWKKEDFINGGDRYPVTFDENSRVGVYLSRTYPVDKFKDTYALTRTNDVPRELWRGWEDVHLIVQDGEQFFIAQTDFRPKEQTLFEVHPAKVKWAEYNPKGPWDFQWDKNSAIYKEHVFTDVRAAGWMIAKPTKEIATLWLKWYGFGMDAVVNRPQEASWIVPMVKADGSAGGSGLYIAKDEVTYEQWIRVYNWASRNQYCLHKGYNFNQDGNPGSAVLDGAAHSSTEPVTGITWQDAVLWCNALSEYEGRTPCYYEDAAFTKVLRSVKDRTGPETITKLPAIYLKADADGFRLPAAFEFSAKPQIENHKWWNFVWDVAGTEFNPSGTKIRTVLGGPGNPAIAALPAGEIPSRGHYAISFRPVRCEGPAKAPEFKALASASGLSKQGGLTAWSFGEEEVIKPAAAPEKAGLVPAIPLIEADGLLAGKTEVTYAQWKAVFNWAELNGCRFDRDGDIGSTKRAGSLAHKQDEPVTSVGILDAMVWCNALSEMKGLKPCYYADKELTQPLRTVHPARALGLPDRKSVYSTKPVLAGFFGKSFFADSGANGFRLSTNDEWTKLAGAEVYPSGQTPDLETMWILDNSGEQTHPAGLTKPTGAGFHDLAGNAFEWTLGVKSDKTLFQSARGGSFRSETKTDGTPVKNATVSANWSFGGSMNMGIANAETGFRVVQNKK
jgi:formylglycine-generating enzyme required for sulfatase activity